MKIIQLVFLFQFLIFYSNCQSTDQAAKNEQPIVNRVNDYLEKIDFSGTVLLDVHGEKLLSKGYGMSDENQQIKNKPNTVFDIGSITKQFTAAGILMLEMQGKLSVNDLLSKYFDNVPTDKKDITLHHLLTHSSGLTGGIGDDYSSIKTDEFIQLAFRSKLLFKPGTQYEYSNVGYSLLAIIIENLSQTTYEDFLYQNLWKPAGMEMTGYSRPNFTKQQVAIGYHKGKEWGRPNEKNWNGDAPYLHLKGNGGILSTTEDMYKWHKALLTDKILSKTAKEKYFKPYVREGEDADSFYAYGWAIFKTSRNTTLIAHNGGNGIFFADFWRYVEDESVIIVMTNKSNRNAERITSQIGAMAILPDFEPNFPSSKEEEIDQALLEELAKKAVDAISKNDPSLWQSFIENNGTKDFINMAQMNVHLNFFKKFHSKIKNGTLQKLTLEQDELIVLIKTSEGMIELIMGVEETNDGTLKFGGMMLE